MVNWSKLEGGYRRQALVGSNDCFHRIFFLNVVALSICNCARELNKKENRLRVFHSCLNACSENKGISMTGLKESISYSHRVDEAECQT